MAVGINFNFASSLVRREVRVSIVMARSPASSVFRDSPRRYSVRPQLGGNVKIDRDWLKTAPGNSAYSRSAIGSLLAPEQRSEKMVSELQIIAKSPFVLLVDFAKTYHFTILTEELATMKLRYPKVSIEFVNGAKFHFFESSKFRFLSSVSRGVA